MTSFFRRLLARRRAVTPPTADRSSMRALRTRLFVWPLEDRVTPAVFTVTTAADTGAGSLRDAITQSNGSTGSLPNVINFDATFFSTPRTITLGSVLPTFTQPVMLNGTSARNVVISGNNAVQIMRTGTAAGITLNDLTLANGRGYPGGAVYVASGNALTLNRSTVTGNVSSGSGGAVYFFSGGTFNATGCTFSNNQGGGSGGGAVYFWAAVNSTIADCTFTGNTSTVANGGGAIRLQSFSGTLNVRNSTLTGNTATIGTGGAISGTGGTVNVFSSIVAGNTGGASPNIAAGTVNVNFSAIDNTAGFTLSGTSGNNLTAAQSTVANLALGALANNGGPTDTMMPGAASTALDAGSNSFGLVTDQRGFGFYRTYSAAGVQKADIGAAERQPAGLPFAQATAANVTVPGPSPNTFTVTYTAAGGALINVGSLGTGDVNLTGPGGYNVTPTFVSAFPNVSSPVVTATYSFVPPGGAWDAADNGTYTVAMNANQVFDTAATPLAVPAVAVGTFTAVLPVTFVVTNLSDTGAGSLRNAITQANADTTTADFIAFQPGLTGTITLASTLPTITGPVTINGPGATVVTVSGNNAVRPFAVNGTGVINVGLNGLTISGGNAASGFGGGVYVTDENLSMDGVVISGNTIAGQGGGIGFSGAGTLMLTNSTVSGNTATGGDGGGIYFFSGGSFVIRNCTISGNTAGAATGGGGVYFWGAANTAGLPAGFTSGTLVLQNSTVAANTTGALGGGIFLNNFGTSTMLVQNSTIVGNTSTATTTGGGGIRVNSGTLTLQNTVVSGNTNTTSPDVSNAGGGTVNANFSAIGSATGLTLSGTSANNLAYGANLQLGTLGSNGGPTQTIVPASTSPLLDAGSNALIPPVLTTDQRGLPLNRVYNAVVDIGAVERQPFPPLVTVASTPLTYTENGPAVVLDPALTVVDFDSTNLTSVVVAVSNYVAGEDGLGFNVAALPTGVTANTGVPGQITFAGLATPAMYQALLQTVTYANASDNPTTTPRGITFAAYDDSSPVPITGPVATRTVSVAAVNDAPVNAVPGTTPIVIASTTGPIPGVSVTDVDVGTGTLTVTVSVPAASGGTFGGTGFTGGVGTNSVTVTGTQAAVAAALGSLTFTAPATPQFITATVAASDNGNTGSGGTLTDTDTFTIFAADPLPVVVTTGGATTYTENAPPVVIDAGVTVADNGAQLSGGTVQVTGGYTFGVDVLSFTPGGGVTGSFDAATGTLALTGVAPLATYQAALRSVRFEAQGDNPPGGTRTVTFVVSDSPALGPPGPSVPVAKTVTVVPVNDPPVNAVPAGPVPTAEDTPLVLPVLLVTDPDNATTTVTLSVANGTLDLTAAGGATVGGSGSGTVTVSGTFPQVNATLAGTLTYTPAADYFGPDALTVASSDGLLTDTDMLAIDVTPVNDPPVIGSLGGPATYQLGHPATPIATTATVVDVDSPDLAGGRLTVLIATGGQAADVLGVADLGTGPGQVGVSGTTVTYGGTPIGTLSGGTTGTPLVLLLNASATPAAVQAVARAVTFQTQTAGVILGARNLSFTLTDGDGGTSVAATLAVQVAPSTAPVLTLGGTGIAYTENELATAVDPGAAVADADSATFANGNLRVDFAGGATTSDRLAILDGGTAPGQIGVSAPRVTYGGTVIGTFTGGAGPGSPLVVTLNANATPAAVQQLVRSVAYANAGDDPGPATRTVRFTLNDGNLGVSTAVTAAVAVTPVNDAPVNTLPAGATDEDTNLAVTGVSVADPDTQGNAIRVTLTAANGTVQLPAVPGLTVTGSGTANVVLDGPLVNVNAALAGLTFRPTADYFGPASVQFVTTDRGFTPGPVQTTTDTLAITVNPVNDAPVLGAVGGTTVYQLGHPAAAVVPAATAVDIDSPDLGGGTLTVALTAGGTAADVLAVQNQGAGAGQIGVIPGPTTLITYGAAAIGFLSGGTGGTPLTVALTTAATPAAVQALARAVTFATPSAGATLGNRRVAFTLTDGDGGTSNTATQTLAVTASTAPGVGLPSGPTTYTENAAGLVLDAAATLSDSDTADFAGGALTVDVTAGGTAADRLDVLDGGTGAGRIGVAGSVVTYAGAPIGTRSGGTSGSSPLVVTLGPGASLAAVQELLRSVAFRNVSDDPVAGPRTVRFRLDDGSLGFSAAVTTTVTLTAVNDAPVVTVPAGPLTTPENTNLRVTDLTVADADADPARVQVSLAVTGGTVLLGIAPGVTMTGNGTAAVTAAGAVANLNAALTGMTFLPATNFNGFAAVRVTADDLGNEPGPALTGTDTFSIAVGSVNNPPANRLPAGPLATNEDTPLTITGLSVTDADAGAANVRVTLAVDHGTVVVRTNVAGGVVAGQVSANGSGAVTLDAPLAAVNATLAAGVVYTPSQDFFGNNTLTVTSDDLGNTGGPAGVDVDPLVIVVASLNDAPTFAVNVPTITLDEDAGATTVSGVTSGASPGPADEAGQTLGWSVAVGSVTGNLAFTSPPSFNPATGTLSFAVAPNTNGTATVNVTLTDSGSGTAPNANATSRPITVVVNAVNDAPSFTLAGNPPAVDQGTGRHDVPNFATGFQRGPAAATDEANQTPTYLLAVTGTTGTLAFTAGPTISAAGTLSYAAAAGTSGTATVSVKVRDSGGTAFGGQDTSAAQTFAITVNRVFVPPTATNDAARVPQGSPATVVDVLANDAPAPVTGGALTISGVTPAARGSVAVTGGGTGLTYTPAARYAGADSFTYTVRDVNGSTATATVQVTVSPVATAYDLVAVGSVSDSRVTVYNATTKTFVTEFFAFGPAFPGGVKVAVGDVNGDGTADVIVGAGLGGAPHVKVIDGTKLGTLLPDGSIPDTALLASFFAFDSTVRGGVFVAAGDVNGDGKADVIVSPGVGGGPHVKVIDGTKLGSSGFGFDGQPLATSLLGSFFAYAPTVRNGLSVAAADVNRDGYVDVITGAGPGGAPHVKVIDGRKLGVSDGSGQPAADALLASYFAYSAAFLGGVNVTGGDLDGDGYAEVITAAGVGGGPDVRVYDGRTGQLRTSFFAFDSASTFGVDVAYRLRADGVPTLAVSELGGIGRFRNYARATLDPVEDVNALVAPFLGGIEVG